jgi:GNAT superfamily N-acetyltransferase
MRPGMPAARFGRSRRRNNSSGTVGHPLLQSDLLRHEHIVVANDVVHPSTSLRAGFPRCRSYHDCCKPGDSETNSAMTRPDIVIDYLASHSERAQERARISWSEWRSIYEQRGARLFDDALRKYRDRLNIDRLRLALVALAGSALVGTISLRYHDLPIRPEISPWLGGLLVMPEWRRRRVASFLMRRAVGEAARLKIPSLFLWTSSAEGLYLKLAWRPIERTDYLGKQIVIMEKEIIG